KSIQKTTHGGLGCDPTALGAANSIGDRRHHIPARFWQLQAENGAGEILVAFAGSSFRGEPHACLKTGNSLNHYHRSDFPGTMDDLNLDAAAAKPAIPGSRLQFSSLQRS